MPLPVPSLDDRRFQNLVDDAKRLVQQRCPEWTDHNVSDPGVTLIEAFAYMTDQLLYRINRVPDRNYVKFLEMIGVRLFPSTPARADLTFWLSAPRPVDVVVPAGAAASTPRGESADSVVTFTTESELVIAATERLYVGSLRSDGTWHNHTEAIRLSRVSAFSAVPVAGEALLIGLSDPVPGCALSIKMDCDLEGVGVDPDHPPLAWDVYDGTAWLPAEVERDTTGGMNRTGEVVIHVPVGHQSAMLNNLRAGWIRARLLTPRPGQAFYSNSPSIARVDAAAVGGTVAGVQGEVVTEDTLGESDGVPGENYVARRSPILRTGEPVVVEVAEVAEGDGWHEWTEVSDFAQSGPEDRHFVLDATEGTVRLGPLVRNADGSTTQYGRVPDKGSVIRLKRYWTGGGRRGNVAARSVAVIRTTVPFVSRVENRRAASGGVDGETVEEAKIRGPVTLRTLGRAVTLEDYEHLAREAAPEAARVMAVAPERPEDAGGVRLLVVPTVPDEDGRLELSALAPPPAMLSAVADALSAKRSVGARVVVEPPLYQGVTVVAQLLAHAWMDTATIQSAATETLYRYLNALTGGPEGTGWPFGRAVHLGEIYALLQGVEGIRSVEDLRLFAADPTTGDRGTSVNKIDVDANALVYSYGHQVRVEV